MSRGLFITFEGTEGAGKSTHIRLLAEHLRQQGRTVRELREPGGTLLGEEIRHLLKHHPAGHGMTAEAELLLINASRAQLVREVIRPALAAGGIVLCDRFADSTTAYQGHGRGLDLTLVESAIAAAVGNTWPDLTLLLTVSQTTSEARRKRRSGTDRFEESGREFFARVESGFAAIAHSHPQRVKVIDADCPLETVQADIQRRVAVILSNA